MGNCYLTNNPGEEYALTVIQQIKLNKLLYHELFFWVEAKKTVLSYESAKKHLEISIENEILRENTISLLEKESKELLLIIDHENFIKDKPYKPCVVQIFRSIFLRHYEFNSYHYLLSMLSLVEATILDKVNFFFDICSKIKRNFTYSDLNIYLYSYLHQNLVIITECALENLADQNERKSSIKLDLDYLLKKVYNRKNICTFIVNILHEFSSNKNFDENCLNKYIITKLDFFEIFADKEYLFDIRILRDHFLTIYRDFL